MSALALVSPKPVAAVEMHTYGKSFCAGASIHDYGRALDLMPPVHRPPVSGQLPFGPRNLFLYQSARSRVIVGRGGFGYAFFDETYGRRPRVDLQWDVTATLSEVDRRGRALRGVDSESQYLGVVSRIDELGFWLDTPPGPALYRYDLEFRDHGTGEILGSYSEYLRVVEPSFHVRLATNRDAYLQGQTAYARVENAGTQSASFGLGFNVQRLAPGGWVPDHLSPSGAVPAVGLVMGGGGSGWCMRLKIPRDQRPGRYRFVRSIGSEDGRHGGARRAEFRVLAR